jgi:hypothetical protein
VCVCVCVCKDGVANVCVYRRGAGLAPSTHSMSGSVSGSWDCSVPKGSK